MNKAILMGRLTRDPEVRYTQSNVPVATFGIAVDRRYKNAQGEREADFIGCVAWRQQAEFVSKWFAKGRMIAVVGSIQTRKYVDRDGNNRTAVEVVVDEAYFCGEKAADGGGQGSYGIDNYSNGYGAEPPARNDYSTAPNGAFVDDDGDGDDELPF